jgi:hypothetical protein
MDSMGTIHGFLDTRGTFTTIEMCRGQSPRLQEASTTRGRSSTFILTTRTPSTASSTRDVAKPTPNASGISSKFAFLAAFRCGIDHLISRELGGADAVTNLWVQPYAGPWNAGDKDRLENRLNKELCQNPTPAALEAARAALTGDWHKAYCDRFVDPKGQPGARAK